MRAYLSLLAGFLGALIPLTAHAVMQIPGQSFGPLCAATGLCFAGPTGILVLQDYAANVLVPGVQMAFVGVAVIYMGWYALSMIVGGYDESILTEQKKAFGYAAVGMGIAGTASLAVQSFSPTFTGNSLIVTGPFTTGILRIANYILAATGAFLIFLIGLAGFRIIVLQGNEAEIDKQKKNFFNGLIGVVILFSAQVVVNSILPSSPGGASDLVLEIGGMARFMLELIAGLAIAALGASGLLMIVALQNDNLRQRGKRIFFSTLVILIVVVFAHTLVSTFIR